MEEPWFGIMYTKLKRLGQALGHYAGGDPRKLARWVTKNAPFYNQYADPEHRRERADEIAEHLDDFRDFLNPFD